MLACTCLITTLSGRKCLKMIAKITYLVRSNSLWRYSGAPKKYPPTDLWKRRSRRNQLGASAHAGPDVWSGSVCIRRETNLHEPRAKQNTSDLVLERHVLALGTPLLKKSKLFECSNKLRQYARKRATGERLSDWKGGTKRSRVLLRNIRSLIGK